MLAIEEVLQLIEALGPAVVGVEDLISKLSSDFSENDKTKVKAALDAAKADDDTADKVLNS